MRVGNLVGLVLVHLFISTLTQLNASIHLAEYQKLNYPSAYTKNPGSIIRIELEYHLA